MARGPIKYLLYIASAVLIFLGIIFMMSINLGLLYFIIGLVFIGLALVMVYISWERKPIEIKKTIEISGIPKVKELPCPNCGAMLDPSTAQVTDGRPYITCKYCGNRFEITEEPKW